MLRNPRLSAAWLMSIAREKISCEDRAEGDCISRKVPKLIIPSHLQVGSAGQSAIRVALRRKHHPHGGRAGGSSDRWLSTNAMGSMSPVGAQFGYTNSVLAYDD